jgi:two-component system, OmpR family, response regulator
MSCPHCERLREENRLMARELGLRRRDGEIGAVMHRLGLTATQAKLMVLMYEAKGRVISHGNLISELPMDGDHKSLKTTVCRMRRVLGEGLIDTRKGFGYALSPAGLSRVLGALRPPELQDAR